MLCSRRVEHVVPVFGAGLGGTPENVIPASHFILERSDQALEHGRDVLVIHRCTSVIAVLTFRWAAWSVAATVPRSIPATCAIVW